MPNILICDDERSICEMLDITLRREGYKVETVNSGEVAKRKLDSALYDVVITDIKMPNIDGIEVLRHAHKVTPDSAVILITAVDDYEAAVEAVKAGGASDYIRKSPAMVDEIKLAIRRSLEKVSLSRQNFALKRDAATRNSLENIIGVSTAMEHLKDTIRTVASTQSTVLIYGESGTGKELVARAVHYTSARASAPFIPVNCGGIPEGLLESELFGYVKGAFTGATETRAGFFQTAEGGTIFLDEISETSSAMQVKLLRVLQDKEVCMVGDNRARKVDVRIVAATNKDLLSLVQKGAFREDLFFRLNVVTITVPPLREREGDVVLLLRHFAAKYAREFARPVPEFTDAALRIFNSYYWPGHVRELENVVLRLIVMTDRPRVDAPDLPAHMRFSAAREAGLNRSLAEVESEHILNVLANVGGNRSRAAEILGIDRKTLRDRLKKLGHREADSAAG